MSRRATIGASVAFFLVGPGLEAGLGPFLVTGGWRGELRPALAAPGALLVLAGLGVLVCCFAGFVRTGRGTPTPAAPTRALVREGPYRVVRNPQHLATAAVVVGEALVLARPILLLAVVAYLTTMALVVRRVEEPALRTRFGPAYDVYRAQTPAWLPHPARRG